MGTTSATMRGTQMRYFRIIQGRTPRWTLSNTRTFTPAASNELVAELSFRLRRCWWQEWNCVPKAIVWTKTPTSKTSPIIMTRKTQSSGSETSRIFSWTGQSSIGWLELLIPLQVNYCILMGPSLSSEFSAVIDIVAVNSLFSPNISEQQRI